MRPAFHPPNRVDYSLYLSRNTTSSLLSIFVFRWAYIVARAVLAKTHYRLGGNGRSGSPNAYTQLRWRAILLKNDM